MQKKFLDQAIAARSEHGFSRHAERKLDAAIAELVGSNASAAAHFKRVVIDAWRQLQGQAEEHNSALREIAGMFGTHQGALATNLQSVDTARIRGFDELTDFASREFPHIVSHFRSEAETGSAEEGLAKAFRKGIQPIHAPYSNEVLELASEMVGQSFWQAIEQERDEMEHEQAEQSGGPELREVSPPTVKTEQPGTLEAQTTSDATREWSQARRDAFNAQRRAKRAKKASPKRASPKKVKPKQAKRSEATPVVVLQMAIDFSAACGGRKKAIELLTRMGQV